MIVKLSQRVWLAAHLKMLFACIPGEPHGFQILTRSCAWTALLSVTKLQLHFVSWPLALFPILTLSKNFGLLASSVFHFRPPWNFWSSDFFPQPYHAHLARC
jgi:hypothetical protein